MTLYMYDDVTVSLIPSNAEAVAGYANGIYANMTALRAKFPHAHILDIAVSASVNATCLDIETGDATNAQAPAWVKAQHARGVKRPVVYTSAGNAQALINTLANNGIARSTYVLWTAHYTNVAHVCGAHDGYPEADGTQFTSRALGRSLDESEVTDAFFGSNIPTKPASVKQPTPPTPPAGKQRVPDCRGMSPKNAKNQLLRYGFEAEGTVGVANTCCWETNPAHWSMETPGSKVSFTNSEPPEISLGSTQTPWNEALQAALVRAGISIAIDGAYGPATDTAVRYFQYEKFGIAGSDGIVGKLTWDGLMNAVTVDPPVAPKAATFPAPANLKVSPWIKHDITWSAAKLNGKAAASYTLEILDVNGKKFAETTVKGTSYTISVPKGEYEIRVWANGGPSGPPHASVKITTS